MLLEPPACTNVLLDNRLLLTQDLAPTRVHATDLLLQLLVMGAFVVAVSAVFFVLVERPCLDRA